MKDYRYKGDRPQDDFFKYATATWLDENPQPDDYPVWNTFTKMSDDNLGRIRNIIENPDDSKAGHKMWQLYDIIMNDTRRQNDGVKPVRAFIAENISPIETKDELFDFLSKEREFPFFSIFNDIDMKDSSMYTVSVWQGGMELGNKEYYLSADPEKVKVMDAFKKMFLKVMKKFRIGDEDAERRLDRFLRLETCMAYHSYSIEDQQEPSKNYHPYTVDEASGEFGIDFGRMLKLYGFDETDKFIVSQPDAVREAANLWAETPLEILKEYVEENCMLSCTGVTDNEMFEIAFEFSQVLDGAKKPRPRWKRAVGKVNSLFADEIGREYVNRYFDEDSKAYMDKLVDNMKASYSQIIGDQEWMADATRALAQQKLYLMGRKLGYPKKFDDLSNMPVDPEKPLFDNMRAISDFMFELDKSKHYNKPVDPDEWHMSPQTVNAYYSPVENEIVFPAGILQEPFFSPKQSDAENYGCIGVVIGHEMTHGFDNHGREFDVDGNMNDWWSAEDVEKFKGLVENTRRRFDSIEALPGLKCDGSLTLGENLADYGGLKIAYNAFKLKIGREPSFEEKDAFFRSYATAWAGVTTDEAIRDKVLNNEHSVNFIRVNGTLPMFNEWCDAYGVKEGDGMYVAPEDRAKIW